MDFIYNLLMHEINYNLALLWFDNLAHPSGG